MHRFPAHVPILACSGDDADFLSTALSERFLKRMRIARIAGNDDISPAVVSRLLLDHELILVETGTGDQTPPPFIPEMTDIVRASAFGGAAHADQRIASWLKTCRRNTPVFGAVLIGGKSSRMGQPKHLIKRKDGHSWLEHLISMLEPFVTRQVVSGGGELPGSTEPVDRVDDLNGVHGPLAGIGALLRAWPFVSWLVCACDMPQITAASIGWLLEQRDDGHAAIIPKNPETGKSEPLFAWYDYRCRPLVDDLIAAGSRKISDLCSQPTVIQPEIPYPLVSCWRNINYPDQLD